MLCDLFFNRQRKKRQDHRASLKVSKNRHDLYADELVGLLEYKTYCSVLERRCKTYHNIFCVFLQERLTVGRIPEAVADMVPEGEVILTINVYYPAVYEAVSFHLFQRSRNPPNLTICYSP